jgi:hypothetical protein
MAKLMLSVMGAIHEFDRALIRDYQDLYKQPTHPVLGLSRIICRIGSPTSAIWCY